MPLTLAHPTASPTTDRPLVGEILRGGGTAMGGTDQLGLPVAGFVWTGTLWVPMSGTADGSLNVNTTIADVLSEYSAAAILTAVKNLLTSMGDGLATETAVAAELRKLTGLGAVGKASRIMPPRQATVAGHPVTDISNEQGMKIVHDIAAVAFDANRKYVGIDAGAYVSPVAPAAITDTQSVVTFTGTTLLGRSYVLFNCTDRMYHTILTAVDPAGGAVGTLTVAPAIPSANAVLRIPFTSTPSAMNTAADAMQTIDVVAPPKGVNGPAVLLSNAALVEAMGLVTNIDVPVSNYDLDTIQIFSDCAVGGETYQWDIFGRIDDQAAGDWQNINGWFNVAGSALGGAADPIGSLCRISVRTQLRELRVTRTKGAGGGAAAVRVWIMEGR
jgi:hypothetical protein